MCQHVDAVVLQLLLVSLSLTVFWEEPLIFSQMSIEGGAMIAVLARNRDRWWRLVS